MVGGHPRSQFIYISRSLMARLAERVFTTGSFDGLTILHQYIITIYGNSDSQPEGFPSFVGGGRLTHLLHMSDFHIGRVLGFQTPLGRHAARGCMQCNLTAGDGLTRHRIGRARFEERPDVTDVKSSARFEMKWI